MVKYHIKNWITSTIPQMARFETLTEEEHIRLYDEIKNATLQGIANKLENLWINTDSNDKLDNKVNSLLLWVLTLTDNKPIGDQKIKSPGSYCDIDLDFSQEKREKVFKYLIEKYGQERCGQIATFGTMGAKASVRNATRSLGFSMEIQNKIAKHIPEQASITIQDAIDASKDFKELIIKDATVKKIIDVARKLEGLPNSLSVHASAGVISDVATVEHIPMMMSAKKDKDVKVITQWDMKDVEAGGLLKFDILGLKNLDVISESVKLIKKNKGIDIDIHNIDMNDPGIYKLLNDGHVSGIFQFDGSAAVYLPQLKPENINEISDITSIIRPGPRDIGMIEQYRDAKFDGKKYEYDLKDKNLIQKVWDICYRSYGLMVYQEQVIRCFSDIGQFDEIEADNARRALGKKLPEEMAKLKGKFIEGGVSLEYNEKDLGTLFDQIDKFSGYGFNASHAVCYSFITCQTAYLSYYYPLEFFTAALSIDAGSTDQVRNYIKAIKDRGYEILPPDINRSSNGFTIVEDTGILFGLGAIKGVGQAVSKKIMTRKPKSGYKTFGHFVRRNIDLINSKILESYAKGGCFKSFGYNKETFIQSIPYILDFNSTLKEYSKYNTAFDIADVSLDNFIDSCIIKTSQKEDDLGYEIDSLGLYISKHPLDDYELRGINDLSYVDFFEGDDEFISIGCLSSIEIRKTKAKLNMCKFNLTSSTYNLSCIMFPRAYSKFINSPIIEEGKMVVVSGKLKKENDAMMLMVNDISDDVKPYITRRIKDAIEFVINPKLTILLEKQ
jgi:DNA polymerase-3 subunit alpha